jgi:hypothetical protein
MLTSSATQGLREDVKRSAAGADIRGMTVIRQADITHITAAFIEEKSIS